MLESHCRHFGTAYGRAQDLDALGEEFDVAHGLLRGPTEHARSVGEGLHLYHVNINHLGETPSGHFRFERMVYELFQLHAARDDGEESGGLLDQLRVELPGHTALFLDLVRNAPRFLLEVRKPFLALLRALFHALGVKAEEHD